jgi:hypothetical protein
MLISDYLNNPKLKLIEQAAIHDKENFEQHTNAAAELLFGKDVHPIIWSNAKKFKKSILSDPDLNKKGLHLFRYAFSTYAARHRTHRLEFLDQGHIKIGNFLPKEFHNLVQKECMAYPICVNKQHFNNCQRESKNNLGIEYLINKSNMKKIVIDCIGVDTSETIDLYNQNTFIQRVENNPNDSDEQKDIHSDIFFPAVKWWYFPDDVNLGDGPFRFQTSPPSYDKPFWDWLYNQSVDLSTGNWDRSKLRGHIEGSLRVNQIELDQMGITISPIVVKANTLVVANVQLFHGRGDTTHSHIRNAIHGSIRIKQPFKI